MGLNQIKWTEIIINQNDKCVEINSNQNKLENKSGE